VLLESHGALSWSTDLLAAYHKMESVEFYAELLYKSKMLGGPKEFDKANIKKLYEIRRKFGMPGKHPANVCLNAGKDNCHNCGGNCAGCNDDVMRTMPGYNYDFSNVSSSDPVPTAGAGINETMIAEIVRKVVAEMK
ncbi:MAG: class II aldolase/adducin family protein, partial [Lachnospiraceae bacterium]|nr:class II aldolase/adducin family protein [Lachnospiraceae bacterium]